MSESEVAEALQHEQDLEHKATEVKATLEQRRAERKDIAAKNRQARCADLALLPCVTRHVAAGHARSNMCRAARSG
jgi:hypothetical protein